MKPSFLLFLSSSSSSSFVSFLLETFSSLLFSSLHTCETSLIESDSRTSIISSVRDEVNSSVSTSIQPRKPRELFSQPWLSHTYTIYGRRRGNNANTYRMQAGLTNSLGFSVEGSEIQGHRQLPGRNLPWDFHERNIGHGVCKQTRTHTEPRRGRGGVGMEETREPDTYTYICIYRQTDTE